MEKSEFYAIFTEYAQRFCDSGHEERERSILEICEKQPELLIMPDYDKDYYIPAAKLIARLGYGKFKNHIEEVFVWLQDLNWPAADIIIEFLASIPHNELIVHLKEILQRAYKDNDDCWISGILCVVKRAELSNHFYADDEFRKILEFCNCSENAKEDIEDPFEISDFDSQLQSNLHEQTVTKFDLHFCSREELGGLIHCMALWNAAKTEGEKQRQREVIVSIREGYKFRFNK